MRTLLVGLSMVASLQGFAQTSENRIDNPTIRGWLIKPDVVLADYVCLHAGFQRSLEYKVGREDINDVDVVAKAWLGGRIVQLEDRDEEAFVGGRPATREEVGQVKDFVLSNSYIIFGYKKKIIKSILCE